MTSEPPFFPQERYDTCALACLRMVLAGFGRNVSEAELVRASSMEEGGVEIEALAELAREYGLRADVAQLSLADLARHFERELLAIVYLNRLPLDRQFAIHAVVPIRLSPHYVTCLDPLIGRRRISRRKFEHARRYLDRYGVVCGLPNASESTRPQSATS